MTTTTTAPNTTHDYRPDDVKQAEKLAGPGPSREVPPAFAKLGYELLATPGFNISDEFYIYRPLRAWDAAQAEVDNLIRITGGGIYTFVESIREALRAVTSMAPEDGQSEAEFSAQSELIWSKMVMSRWADFLLSVPNFNPAEWATRMLKKCEVRRIAKPEHHSKPDTDPTKDCAGLIFECTGFGHVDSYYRGRRSHLVRVGIAAGWGSIGDFFVES